MDQFSALADPTRRQILELLARQGQLSAGSIAENFALSGPAISQHLKILREAELVERETRAQQRLYQLNDQTLQEVERWLSDTRAQWNARFDRLERAIAQDLIEGSTHE